MNSNLFFILILTGYSLKSQAEFCPQLYKSSYEVAIETAKIKDEIETSPFMMACKEPPDLLKNRPKTGLLVRSVIEKDSQGRSTKDLLTKILNKVRTRVSEATNQINNISKCMYKNTPECFELKNWVDVELPAFVKGARYNLSLAQSQHEVKTWTGIASKKVNSNLSNLGSYKLKNWQPLSAQEKANAEKQLSSYQQEIKMVARQKLKDKEICSTCLNQFSDEALLTVRFQHYQMYHQMLSEVPLLQYLEGPNVSKAEIASAFTKMKADLQKESAQLDEYEKLLKESPLSTDVLQILNYSSQLEETLMEDQRDCGLASSLVYTRTNRQIGNGLAIGLPVLAVSFFAAPVVVALGGTAAMGAAVTIGTGAAAGGALALKSFSDFRKTQARTLGYVYGDSLGADQASLDTAYRRAKYDAVTLPVGFGLGGLALRSLTVGAKSLATGRSIFKGANKP